MSSISNKDYIPGLLRISSVLAGTSNKIPSAEDYCFAQLDPEINSQFLKIEEKLTTILSQVLSFVTPNNQSCDYEEVVEASDRCLEHVAVTLENMKNPKKTISKLTNYDLPKPVLPKVLNNSSENFLPIIQDKPNSLISLEKSPSSHPYLPELEKLVIRPEQMKVETVKFSKDLKNPVIYVDTFIKFQEMIEKLENSEEIAVDLEHHSLRSYLGFTCLMQISTRDEDFILDPFPLWESVHKLRKVFTDPNIVKVFHGADSDVLWLQRDFGIHVVNMFDTGQAARKLMFSHFGLGFLLEQLCGVKTDKNYQLADWRVRPLTEDHLKYARIDTHYLLEIYDKLKEMLIARATCLKLTPFELVKDVFIRSKEICMKIYEKPDLTWIGINGTELLDCKQKKVLQGLAKWRDLVARNEDESPAFIVSGRKLLNIAVEVPDNLKSLGKIIQNISFINRYGSEVLKVIQQVDFTEVTEINLPKVFKEAVKIHDDQKSEEIFLIHFKQSPKPSFDWKPLPKFSKSQDTSSKVISKSLGSIFDSRNLLYFNKNKPMILESKKSEVLPSSEAKSLQEQFFIPIKTKMPSTRKPKQTQEKKQKVSEKKDIRIGWMDNVELQPVKRKNLFKKKR
jgi:ribonuclease D